MERIKFDPPRPKCSENTVRQGVRKYLNSYPLDGYSVKKMENEIVDCFCLNADGYYLAKELESDYFWDIDMQIVEWLDNVSLYVDRALETEEKEWAEKNNIQPPFPVGTRVECRHAGKSTGVIDGVYKHSPARYLIKIDDETPSSLAIVKFEDCSLIQTSNAD